MSRSTPDRPVALRNDSGTIWCWDIRLAFSVPVRPARQNLNTDRIFLTKQQQMAREVWRFWVEYSPSDSLVFSHVYLFEVYSRRNELERAMAHRQEAERLAEHLGLSWLKDLLPQGLESETANPASS